MWVVQHDDQQIDLVQLVRWRHTGAFQVNTLPQTELNFLKQWEQWVLSNQDEWMEDSLVTDQVIRVHCSGLEGGLSYTGVLGIFGFVSGVLVATCACAV